MWNRDWPGWRMITVLCTTIVATGTMFTPENLGLNQITINWLILIATIVVGFAGTMSNSFAPGDREIADMSAGKADRVQTATSKAEATATITSGD